MGLNDTIKSMHKYLECISKDLKKAEKGNKAACQRVRTCSIKFSKVAKNFRKESVAEGKKSKKKKTTKTIRKPIKKAAKKSTKRKTTKRKKRK